MNKVPQAWLQAGVKKQPVVASGQKVTARINMSAEVAGAGLCPECHRTMVPGFANGIPVLICHEDRIAIPTADPVEATELEIEPGIKKEAVLGPSTAESPV